MERLFKIRSVYHSTFKGKNEGDAERQKVEITLSYHETYYSSQSGPGIRQQNVVVTLLDDNAANWHLSAGHWIVASVSMACHESRTEPGRMVEAHYLDRFIPVTDWNTL